MNLDSLPRLLEFLRCLSTEQFEVNNKLYIPPEKLLISDSFFRSYICPPGCGGCCRPVSLLYFEHNIDNLLKEHPNLSDDIKVRSIRINNILHTYYEIENKGEKCCRFLCPHDKRCTIHGEHPLLCRFELKKFIHYKDKVVLTKKLPGRGWLFGAKCTMIKFDKSVFLQDLREFDELEKIANNFGIKHKIGSIILELINKGEKFVTNQTITN